jgi:hypothetical protein
MLRVRAAGERLASLWGLTREIHSFPFGDTIYIPARRSVAIECSTADRLQGRAAMTRLLTAVRGLGLDVEVGQSGRWVRFHGPQCTVYVLEALWGSDYYMWCDGQGEQGTQLYRDPVEAIQAGLRRSAGDAGNGQ